MNQQVLKIGGLIKKLLGTKNDCSIPLLQTGDDFVSDKFANCELFNDLLSKQSSLGDSNMPVPEPTNPPYDKLISLHILENYIEDVLKLLDATKATRPDLINNRLHKDGAFILKHSL